MSSGTSTSASDDVRLKPDAGGTSEGLQPWQLFVLAALTCATGALFLTRTQGVTGVILLSILIGTAALVGLAGIRAVRPLVTDADDRTRVVGGRTREALEREKTLALRALKELEFDRAMGKLSDSDFAEMSGRLRARATRLIRQLDSGEDYRARIEHDLARRLSQAPEVRTPATAPSRPARSESSSCAACETVNDADARFCKSCGAKL